MKRTLAFRTAIAVAALATLGVARVASAQKGSSRTIPPNTIVRAELDDQLSSRTARKGDVFTATLSDKDYSGLPEGTRFQGVVQEVQKSGKDKPGVLAVRFQRVMLPGGASQAFAGELADLKEKGLRQTSSGRLESKAPRKKFDARWVGYGAAGGAILGTILGGATSRGAILGGLGGAAYAYLNKSKKKEHGDVELSQDTEFGIRLNDRVAFTDKAEYRYARYERDRDR